jgi:hypothetical protein
MRFRLKAFALHLIGSICALTLVLGGLYAGWYRWPGWYLTGVEHVLLIVGIVDLGIGPTLTGIIANPKKPRRTLARDIAVIAIVQVAALAYGAWTLWQGRPLYYAFSVNSLQAVQASDISSAEIAAGLEASPALAPHWYSRPRWVYAPLPKDPDTAGAIVSGAAFGQGADVVDMPKYFQPWEAGLPELRTKLSALADNKFFSKNEKKLLEPRLTSLGLKASEPNALIMWGGTGSGRKLYVVFDPESLKIKAMLRPD